MSDILTESSYRSRYGFQKLRDHTYHTWSFQCRLMSMNGKRSMRKLSESSALPSQTNCRDPSVTARPQKAPGMNCNVCMHQTTSSANSLYSIDFIIST